MRQFFNQESEQEEAVRLRMEQLMRPLAYPELSLLSSKYPHLRNDILRQLELEKQNKENQKT